VNSFSFDALVYRKKAAKANGGIERVIQERPAKG
jgi:hypothetical protein